MFYKCLELYLFKIDDILLHVRYIELCDISCEISQMWSYENYVVFLIYMFSYMKRIRTFLRAKYEIMKYVHFDSWHDFSLINDVLLCSKRSECFLLSYWIIFMSHRFVGMLYLNRNFKNIFKVSFAYKCSPMGEHCYTSEIQGPRIKSHLVYKALKQCF